MTDPQRRMLERVVADGGCRFNGRGRRSIEALEKLGLVEYDYTLEPHANGRYTEVFLVRATAAGRDAVGPKGRIAELEAEIDKQRAKFNEAVERGVTGAPLVRIDQKLGRLEHERDGIEIEMSRAAR